MMTKELFFEGLAGGATWSAGVAFKRSNPLPLDRYSVFGSKADAETYLSNAVCYPGQVLAVIENIVETVEDVETVVGVTTTVYVVAVDKDGAYTLEEVGTKPIGDDASIEVKEDGTVTIYGFDTATDGYIPQKVGGKVEWVPISSVVEGDTNTVTSGDDNTIKTSGDADKLTATLVGFEDATEGQIAYKTAEGKLGWKTEYSYDDSEVKADIEALEGKVDVDSVSGAIDSAKSEAISSAVEQAGTAADAKYVAKEGFIAFTQDEKDKLAGLSNYDDTALAQRVTDAEEDIATVEGDVATIKSDYLKSSDKDAIETAYKAADKALDDRLVEVETFFHTAEGETLSDALDTLVEIQKYITDEGAAADEMVKDIEANATAITAEKERAEAAEATLTSEVAKKADATQVATDISTAKSQAIESANATAQEKADAALETAKEYTDSEVDKLEVVIAEHTNTIAGNAEAARADATSKANLAEQNAKDYADEQIGAAKTELQGAINTVDGKLADYAKAQDVADELDAVNTKFDSYYTKTEIDTTVSGINEEVSKKALATDLTAVSDKVDALAGIKKVSDEFTLDASTGELAIDVIAQSKVADLDTALANKVTRVSTIYNDVDTEWTLLSPENQAKLEALVIGDEGGVEISGKVNAENVEGLDSYISGKRNTLGGLLSEANEDALAALTSGQYDNKVNGVELAGTLATIDSNKNVIIPYATNDLAGLVKSAEAENKVSVGIDGTMTVNNLNVNKLVQTGGDTFILDGGSASA